MMEWIALIPTGHNIVRVRFSGGSLSGYGVTPATFTTSNPVVMKMIENSAYFKNRKIRLIKKDDEIAECESEGCSPSADPSAGQIGMVAFRKEKR